MKNLFFAFAFLSFLFSSVALSATSPDFNNEPIKETVEESPRIFVHITAVIEVKKNTPKGAFADVVLIRLGRKANPSANEFTGTMDLQNGRVKIQIGKSSTKIARLRVPAGFKLSPQLSEKLGAPQPVVMSGGSTMVRKDAHERRMLWFEIQ